MHKRLLHENSMAYPVKGGREIGDLYARIDDLIANERVPDNEAIRLAEVASRIQSITKKHCKGIWIASRSRDLPDPGVRPTFEEARDDNTFISALGFIWRTREYLQRMEAKYRVDDI